MGMIYHEFSGKRAGWFRQKPTEKVGDTCPRCGSHNHIGITTCDVKTLNGLFMPKHADGAYWQPCQPYKQGE